MALKMFKMNMPTSQMTEIGEKGWMTKGPVLSSCLIWARYSSGDMSIFELMEKSGEVFIWM